MAYDILLEEAMTEISTEANPTAVNPTMRTVKVQVRHSPDCKDRDKGVDWKRCRCPKILRIYEGGGSGANKRAAAKTRSWEEAERQAQDLRDSWDPVKQELKKLKAEKESKQVTMEEAVALHIANKIADLGDNGTVNVVCSMLGRVDQETKKVLSTGICSSGWQQSRGRSGLFTSRILRLHI